MEAAGLNPRRGYRPPADSPATPPPKSNSNPTTKVNTTPPEDLASRQLGSIAHAIVSGHPVRAHQLLSLHAEKEVNYFCYFNVLFLSRLSEGVVDKYF